MRQAEGKPNTHPSETQQSAARAVPTFIATDLLEKLIEDQDALAVRKAVTKGRQH